MYTQGILLDHPHLYQVITPAEYLIPAIYYISIRMHIYGQKSLKKTDVLFFLPVFIQLIDFMPFYMLGAAEKKIILQHDIAHTGIVSTQDVGYLPAYFHVGIKYLYAGILCKVLWVKFFLQHKKSTEPELTKMEKWTIFNMSVFSIGIVSPVLLYLLRDTNITYPYFYSTFFTVIVFGIFFNLSISPEILYENILKPQKPIEVVPYEVNFTSFKTQHLLEEDISEFENEEAELEIEQKKFQLEKDLLESYKVKIESFLIHEKPFLKPGYSLSDLSSDLNIPKHHLSMTFTAAFNSRYNDLLNNYRIEYAKKLISDKSNEHLTLEAIATESGFNSRVTFIRAFTKLTGMNPSDFNKDIKV
jgi:AraC-like DNA-binding protein